MFKVNCYSDIPGWGDFLTVYKELLSLLPDDCDILELGVGVGRSTWAMLDAMKDQMNLYVIDNFELDSSVIWRNFLEVGSPSTSNEKNISEFKKMTLTQSHQEIFLHNIKQNHKYSQIKEIHKTSSEEYISSNKKNNFDLVFLDGDHSYETVKEELEYFKDSTLLAGHDYGSHEPGVVKAVDEFMLTHKDRRLKIYEENEVFVIQYHK